MRKGEKKEGGEREGCRGGGGGERGEAGDFLTSFFFHSLVGRLGCPLQPSVPSQALDYLHFVFLV